MAGGGIVNRQFPIKRSPPDERDYKLTMLMATDAQLPSEAKNSQWLTHIYDQGSSGFCWAFCIAQIINYYCNKNRVNSEHILSPLYVAQAVKNSLYVDFPDREGESIRSAVKGGQKAGSVAEVRYPYDAYLGTLQFPQVAEDLARVSERFRLGPYAKVSTLDEIRQSLNAGKPVASGVLWTDRFFDRNWLDWPYGKSVGGHAIPLFDYSDTLTKWGRTGWIKFPNSWGEGWGTDKGYGYISYDYINYVDQQTNMPYLFDAYSVDFINTSIPAYNVNLQIDSIDAYADDIPYKLDQAPVIDKATGRTLLPVRAVAEMAGYEVGWDGQTRRINLRK